LHKRGGGGGKMAAETPATFSIREALVHEASRVIALLTHNHQSAQDVLVPGTCYWVAEDAQGQCIGAVGRAGRRAARERRGTPGVARPRRGDDPDATGARQRQARRVRRGLPVQYERGGVLAAVWLPRGAGVGAGGSAARGAASPPICDPGMAVDRGRVAVRCGSVIQGPPHPPEPVLTVASPACGGSPAPTLALERRRTSQPLSISRSLLRLLVGSETSRHGRPVAWSYN